MQTLPRQPEKHLWPSFSGRSHLQEMTVLFWSSGQAERGMDLDVVWTLLACAREAD